MIEFEIVQIAIDCLTVPTLRRYTLEIVEQILLLKICIYLNHNSNEGFFNYLTLYSKDYNMTMIIDLKDMEAMIERK